MPFINGKRNREQHIIKRFALILRGAVGRRLADLHPRTAASTWPGDPGLPGDTGSYLHFKVLMQHFPQILLPSRRFASPECQHAGFGDGTSRVEQEVSEVHRKLRAHLCFLYVTDMLKVITIAHFMRDWTLNNPSTRGSRSHTDFSTSTFADVQLASRPISVQLFCSSCRSLCPVAIHIPHCVFQV